MILELIIATGLTILPETSCPAIPYTESDSTEIFEMMSGFIGDEPIDAVFEKVIEHKCANLKPNPVDFESVWLKELTTFEGYSANTIPSPDTVERDVLVCKIMRIYIDDELKALEKRCDWNHETRIKYPGIEGEIKIVFGVSADEARRFLDYLSRMSGETFGGETISPDVFEGVFQIYGDKDEDGLKITARYRNSCGVRTLSAIRNGGDDADYRFAIAPKSGC